MNCWHRFTNWADVLVFQFGCAAYVLQGHKCKKCLATNFRIVGARDGVVGCEALTMEHLKAAGLWRAQAAPGVET